MSQSQAMDIFLQVADCTGVSQKVVNGLSSILEVPITSHNEFNEHIAKQNGSKAEAVYQREIESIESNINRWPKALTQEDQDYIQRKNQVFVLYNRAEIALLTLDYVNACRNQIDKSLASINEIIQQYKQPKLSASFEKNDTSILEILAQFLQNIRINLGTALQTKYHYERGGGMLSRWNKHSSSQSMRLEDWGVSSFPALDLKANAGIVNWLNSQKQGNAVAQDIFEVYWRYTLTIGFILKPEDMIILNLEGVGGIDYYRKQLTNIFGENAVPTPIKLHSTIFGINDKSVYKTKEKLIKKDNMESRTAPIQIPGSQERKVDARESTVLPFDKGQESMPNSLNAGADNDTQF